MASNIDKNGKKPLTVCVVPQLLMGGKGPDILTGGPGMDIILGKNGADTLSGGAGRDWLVGGKGEDILDGGTGDDVVRGGAGKDRFIHNVTENIDTNNCTYDFYDGGCGADTLELRVTPQQAADLAAAIAAFNASNKCKVFNFQKYVPYMDLRVVNIESIVLVLLNQAPEAQADAVTVAKEAGVVLIDVLANDTDPDALDTLSILSVDATSASGASLSIVSGKIQYNPGNIFQNLSNDTTTDTFSYVIQDNHGATSTATVTITMTVNNHIEIIETVTGVANAATGNEQIGVGERINALSELFDHNLDAGAGTGSQSVLIQGTATGADAPTTFGNYASGGGTAISAKVDIHNNSLSANSTITQDSLIIKALATGGNAGPQVYIPDQLNTGANVAQGAGSLAISAQVIVDSNQFKGGVAGALMLIDAQAKGGDSATALYATQATDGALAKSAEVTVGNNSFEGHAAPGSTGDIFHISALATGGKGAFTATVSGFFDSSLLFPGGTAINAEVNVHDNTMTELGAKDAQLLIDATAIGGQGKFFANYAPSGEVISATVTVDNNHLTGGIGNDILKIETTANGSVDNDANGGNFASVGSTAIATQTHIDGNILSGGDGLDTLSLLIHSNPGTTNAGQGGTEILFDLSVTNNQLLGGAGDDVLVINRAELLEAGSGNILDGGAAGFDSLMLQGVNSVDLTLPNVAGTVLLNMENIDLTDAGATTLTLDNVSIEAINSVRLFVTGDSADLVNLNHTGANTWAAGANNVTDSHIAGHTFTEYTNADGAIALIDNLIILAGNLTVQA